VKKKERNTDDKRDCMADFTDVLIILNDFFDLSLQNKENVLPRGTCWAFFFSSFYYLVNKIFLV
jgi:hypothetical protein